MTKEEKDLLFKDLCARLPYGIIIEGLYNPEIMTIKHLAIINAMSGEPYKPYLRPMSSMTEEEKEEYRNIDNRSYSCPIDYAHIPASDRIDWLNAHHFDYRGLIEEGLALEAPKDMY